MEPLSADEKRFPSFALGVSRGLLRAVLTDSEVLLLASSGILLGSDSKRIRGLGIALGSLVLARRADQYVSAIDSKLGQLVRVIDASNRSSGDANG